MLSAEFNLPASAAGPVEPKPPDVAFEVIG